MVEFYGSFPSRVITMGGYSYQIGIWLEILDLDVCILDRIRRIEGLHDSGWEASVRGVLRSSSGIVTNVGLRTAVLKWQARSGEQDNDPFFGDSSVEDESGPQCAQASFISNGELAYNGLDEDDDESNACGFDIEDETMPSNRIYSARCRNGR